MATSPSPSPKDPTGKRKLDYATAEAGNPFVGGWYLDPSAAVFADGVFWVYAVPHSSDAIDAFSSPDLIHWTKHARVFAIGSVAWADDNQKTETKVEGLRLKSPTPVERNGRFYLYFTVLHEQRGDENGESVGGGGIGVAVSDSPSGPFVDALGKPLINAVAKPRGQDVFIDRRRTLAKKGKEEKMKIYIVFGGHGHGHGRANIALLNEDMVSLSEFDDDEDAETAVMRADKRRTFKEIAFPSKRFRDGIKMFERKGTYYLLWSEEGDGSNGNSNSSIAYAMADNPLGPFTSFNINDEKGTETDNTILKPDPAVALDPGHASVIKVPVPDSEEGEDIWYIFYHRRPLSQGSKHACTVLAYDRLHFKDDHPPSSWTEKQRRAAAIKPVEMLVRDDFSDGAMLAWTPYGGSWSVRNQRLTSSQGMALLDTDFSSLVLDARIASFGPAGGHPGLLFRVSDLTPPNPTSTSASWKYKGYKAAISPGTGSGIITLGKADMGTFTDLAQVRYKGDDMELGTEYSVRVVAVGREISVFVEDMETPVIRYTDGDEDDGDGESGKEKGNDGKDGINDGIESRTGSSWFKSGKTGVRSYNSDATFGNFSVSRPGQQGTGTTEVKIHLDLRSCGGVGG
ncbi:putative glycosyl hydrolase [Xylariaceae sp. FL0594]|nr:putative glycosyl hydrolase [Xylariaceae sp. FL0594]